MEFQNLGLYASRSEYRVQESEVGQSGNGRERGVDEEIWSLQKVEYRESGANG